MKTYVILFYCLGCLMFAACNSGKKGATSPGDSMEIRSLLSKVYMWHVVSAAKVHDFVILVKDTLQVGVDTAELRFAVGELRKTNFFTDEFLANYERIGWEVDNKLRHDTVKYLNEINFSFQDADPWNFFQDDPCRAWDSKYWDSLHIYKFSLGDDTASLRWSADPERDTLGYLVKLKKTDGAWKINYMEGFDLAHLQYSGNP